VHSAKPLKGVTAGSDAGLTCRVLVVDDDALVRRFLADLLRSAGYVVDEAPDGVEAVRRFREHPPGCILIDLQMPRMNGIDALVAMNPRRSGVPVIAISGIPFETESEPGRLAKTMGADRFLRKPVNGGLLLDTIRELTGAG